MTRFYADSGANYQFEFDDGVAEVRESLSSAAFHFTPDEAVALASALLQWASSVRPAITLLEGGFPE